MLQQSLTGIFQDVEHILKALCPSIVRIGYMVDDLGTAELRHAMDFLFALQIGCFLSEGIDVAVVHPQNPIEVIEILRTYRTRTVRQLIASADGMCPHACIRQFSFVKADDACGINFKLFFSSCPTYQRTHDFFGRRGTADVAETDKKYALFFICRGVNTV